MQKINATGKKQDKWHIQPVMYIIYFFSFLVFVFQTVRSINAIYEDRLFDSEVAKVSRLV